MYLIIILSQLLLADEALKVEYKLGSACLDVNRGVKLHGMHDSLQWTSSDESTPPYLRH